MYLAWFDGDRKKPVSQKIEEARERYVAKYGREPGVCLVNPDDLVPESVVALRPLKHIGRNCFWIGFDEADEIADTTAAPVTPTLQIPPRPAPEAPRPARARRAAKVAPVTETAAVAGTTIEKPAARHERADAAVQAPAAPAAVKPSRPRRAGKALPAPTRLPIAPTADEQAAGQVTEAKAGLPRRSRRERTAA